MSSNHQNGAAVAKAPERPAEGAGKPIRTTVTIPQDLYWRLVERCATKRMKPGDGIVQLVQVGMEHW